MLSCCSSLLPLLTLVFCCDVVELGTYGKLKYYHSMTEEGKDERLHSVRSASPSLLFFYPLLAASTAVAAWPLSLPVFALTLLHRHPCESTVVTPSFFFVLIVLSGSAQGFWLFRVFLRGGVPPFCGVSGGAAQFSEPE